MSIGLNLLIFEVLRYMGNSISICNVGHLNLVVFKVFQQTNILMNLPSLNLSLTSI